MKKICSLLFAILFVLLLFTGCAAQAPRDMEKTAGYAADYAAEAPAEMPMEEAYSEETGDVVLAAGSVQKSTDLSEKIIYAADVALETVNFDETIQKVYALVDTYHGFIESSYVSGTDYYTDYYDYQTYRDANFRIRVPVEAFDTVQENVSDLGNVTYINTYAENITAQFTDTESRLATYRTEEARLLSMLEQTTTVAEMIEVEARLSEVRYQIESLTSQLKNWQNQVDYSTISISIQEVKELSEQYGVQRTYWEEIQDGFRASLKGIGRFFKNLVKIVLVAAPVLLLVAVLAVAAVFLIRVCIKKTQRKSGTVKERSRKRNRRGETESDENEEQ